MILPCRDISESILEASKLTIIEYIETWYYEDIRGECNESEIMVKLRSTDVVTVQLAIIRATDYSDVYQLN